MMEFYMRKQRKTKIALPLIALFLFTLWTFLLTVVDVQPIGQLGTNVGFASLNLRFHEMTGVNLYLYTLTDILGLVPILICVLFAFVGVIQLLKRKSIKLVDRDILFLGAFYLFVIFTFVGFEFLAVNYRPILIEGQLEASYPSSTTMLVLCVLPTAFMQIKRRIKNRFISVILIFWGSVFALFVLIARVLSGVHWITDIIGGVIFSIGAVGLYHSVT